MEGNISCSIMEICNMSDAIESDGFNISDTYTPGGKRIRRRRLKAFVSSFLTASFILSWINVLLIISLNVAVIVIILRYKKRSRLYFLLLNLAIADLLTGVIDSLPHSIERSVGYESYSMLWIPGDVGTVTCKIQRYLSNVSIMASNYILAATSIDRALVVAKPLMNFRRGHVLQKCIILSCWILSCLASIPIIILMQNKKNINNSFVCGIYFKSTLEWKYLITIMFVVLVAIPFVVIVVSYTVLIVSIYGRALAQKSSTNLSISQVFNRGIPRTKIRSLKLTIGIVLSFLLSWLVFFIILFMQVFEFYDKPWIMVFVTFYYWNCIANPVLFFIFHKRRTRPPITSYYSSESGQRTVLTECPPSENTGNPNTTNSIPLVGRSRVRSTSPSRMELEIREPILNKDIIKSY